MMLFLPLLIIALFFVPMFLMGRGGGWRHQRRMHHRGRAWGKIRHILDEQQREIDDLKREINDLEEEGITVMKIKLPRFQIPLQYYIIPLILVLCIILALVIGGGVMKWIFVTLGSILGGLGVAGFVTLALNEEKSPRLFGMGIAMMVPVLLVLSVFLGWGWLMAFLPYTGILTVIMLVLDTWRRRANPQPPAKKK